jgi:Peptidase_C39 like family/Tetratricopeptide repeat
MCAPACPRSFLRWPSALFLLAFSLVACPVHAECVAPGVASAALGSCPLPGLPAEVVLAWKPVRAALPDYCGPAALANVLRHWGRPADQVAIGETVFDRRRRGTLAGDLILCARQLGLQAASRSSSRDELRRWLAAGLPVIVLQDLSPQDRRGHFRVVVGYSDTRRQFRVCDCTEPGLCSLDYEQFDDLWFHFDNWCLLAAPAEKIPPSLGAPDNPVLHFDLAEAYLRRGDRDAARQELRDVLRLCPSHQAAGKLLAKLARPDRAPTRGAPTPDRQTSATLPTSP